MSSFHRIGRNLVVRQIVIVVIALAAAGCSTLLLPGDVPSFSVMASGPRGAHEWGKFRQQVGLENNRNSAAFIVHLGGMAQSAEEMTDARFDRIADILGNSRVPALVLPGEPEAGESALWRNYFRNINERSGEALGTMRQEQQPENTAFDWEGLRIVTLRAVEDADYPAAADWLRHGLDAGARIRAGVILAHAGSESLTQSFVDALAGAANDFGRPLLYVHAGKIWQDESGWLVPNMTRVQVGYLGDNPPVRILALRESARPFRFDRQLEDPVYRDDYEPIWKRLRKSQGIGF